MGKYLLGFMTAQRHWGAGLDIDCSASFQLEMNSQTLAEIQCPSNGKHVITINLILMAVSNKTNKKNHFFKMKHSPFKQHSRRSAGC